jgi:hypothetical protein
MTSKADFTEEEWVRLRRAPFVAGLAISIADPGGPIELAKETIATLRATSTPPSQEELLVAVAQEIASRERVPRLRDDVLNLHRSLLPVQAHRAPLALTHVCSRSRAARSRSASLIARAGSMCRYRDRLATTRSWRCV